MYANELPLWLISNPSQERPHSKIIDRAVEALAPSILIEKDDGRRLSSVLFWAHLMYSLAVIP